MIKNSDGSQPVLETVWESYMSGAFDEWDFPNMSHVCGSDWGAHLPLGITPEQYKKAAITAASRIYPDDNGTYEWLIENA